MSAVLRIPTGEKSKLALTSAAFGLVTLLSALIAAQKIFTGFAIYDDEGYMLVALQSFIDRGELYDEVFTQYGPFYFEFWAAVFSVFSIPVTHDGGRLVTAVVWVATSLMLGLSAARLTRSLLVGLTVQLLSFAALAILAGEPMHPGGLICLLLAFWIFVATTVDTNPRLWAAAVLGGGLAALTLVKINIGVFAVAALALAATAIYPAVSQRRGLRVLIEAGFVAIPLLLIAGKFGEGWARQYALHTATSALSLVVVLRATTWPQRSNQELRWVAGGFVAITAASVLAVVGSGTGLGGLFDGLILQPLRQSDAFSIPLDLDRHSFHLGLIALGGAVAYWYTAGKDDRTGTTRTLILAMACIIVGSQMMASVIGRVFPLEVSMPYGYQLLLVPFAWLALAELPGTSDDRGFARLILVPLAALQALHAFPVAGGQVVYSTILLIPLGAVCLVKGLRGIAHYLTEIGNRRVLAALGTLVALVAAEFVITQSIRSPLREAQAAHEAAVPLDLPGARSMRLPEDQANQYRAIVDTIRQECPAFITNPGMGSFYIWTEQSPPTGHFATGWMTLFTHEKQARAVADVESVEGLCLLENEGLVPAWTHGKETSGPLVSFVDESFTPFATFGDYTLSVRARTER